VRLTDHLLREIKKYLIKSIEKDSTLLPYKRYLKERVQRYLDILSKKRELAIFYRTVPFIRREFSLIDEKLIGATILDNANIIQLLPEPMAQILYLTDGMNTIQDIYEKLLIGEYDYINLQYDFSNINNNRILIDILYCLGYFYIKNLINEVDYSIICSVLPFTKKYPTPYYYPPGIKEYLKKEKPLTGKLYAPHTLFWHATKYCNLRCIMCYSNEQRKRLPPDLRTEEVKRIIEEFAKYGGIEIVITGGEPTLRKDIVEILEFISKLNKWGRTMPPLVYFITNGVEIPSALKHKLIELHNKKLLVTLQISIDSGNPEIHESIRGVKGCWKKTVDNLLSFSKIPGLPLLIKTTLNKQTFCLAEDLIKLHKLALEARAGLDVNKGFHIVGGKGIEKLYILDHQVLRLQTILTKYFLNTPFNKYNKEYYQVLFTNDWWRRIKLNTLRRTFAALQLLGLKIENLPLSTFLKEQLTRKHTRIGCTYGGGIALAISNDGKGMFCCFANIFLEKITEAGLMKLWHESKVLNDIRKITTFKDLSDDAYCKQCRLCSLECTAERIEAWRTKDLMWALTHSLVLCPAFIVAYYKNLISKEEKKRIPKEYMDIYKISYRELCEIIRNKEYLTWINFINRGIWSVRV